MSILEKLTEGIVSRDLSRENHALLDKWEKTGLLEGLEDEGKRNSMAVLLENQAKELLREASTMAGATGGNVEGFAAVAFPIVRRVFAGLIANDLVSVQPMSLPSGLIFFLDFTLGMTDGTTTRLGQDLDDSLYGGGVVASQLTGGVSLTGDNVSKSFYNLNNGYSSPTGSVTGIALTDLTSGSAGDQGVIDGLINYDPDIASGTSVYVGSLALDDLTQLNREDLISVTIGAGSIPLGRQARRLTVLSGTAGTDILVVIAASGSETPDDLNTIGATVDVTYVETDNFRTGGAIGSVEGVDNWKEMQTFQKSTSRLTVLL